jgi:protocatechuate 3,4-dioxygenase beta subunit
MRGTVTDPQGAVVANAEVTLQNSTTGVARNQKTSDRGEYQFLQIPPGTYSITTRAAGFVTSRKENAVLLVNTPARLNFALKVDAADTIVGRKC